MENVVPRKLLENARHAHEALRRRAPHKDATHESLCQLNIIRQSFDQLWTFSRHHPRGASMRQCMHRIIADAELYAGVGETPMFADATHVMLEYDLLQHYIDETASDAGAQ